MSVSGSCAPCGDRCAPLIDNDEVGAFVCAYPDRLVGIASVDLSRPMVGIRELRRAVRELGFRGSTYSALVVEPAPDDRRFYALYASRDTLDSPGLQMFRHNARSLYRLGMV